MRRLAARCPDGSGAWNGLPGKRKRGKWRLRCSSLGTYFSCLKILILTMNEAPAGFSARTEEGRESPGKWQIRQALQDFRDGSTALAAGGEAI